MQQSKLPEYFLRQLEALEESYLQSQDPIRQSGFGGGAERWRAEREPILEAIESDGDLLDIGCANGFLLECLVQWGLERGIRLTPYGVDQGRRLIALAQQRYPHLASNFVVGNAWDWEPGRKFKYVYTLYDCVPLEYLAEYVRRLLARTVARSGRLIIGAYGSRTRQVPPFDIAAFLQSAGFRVVGTAQCGSPPIANFAWVDAPADLKRYTKPKAANDRLGMVVSNPRKLAHLRSSLVTKGSSGVLPEKEPRAHEALGRMDMGIRGNQLGRVLTRERGTTSE